MIGSNAKHRAGSLVGVGPRDEQVRAPRPNHATGLEGMQQQAWPIGIAQITVAADP